ncbi:MAG TPA: glycosyl hydrolase [Catenuloplanes sp.]|jgi:hypothetical protein
MTWTTDPARGRAPRRCSALLLAVLTAAAGALVACSKPAPSTPGPDGSGAPAVRESAPAPGTRPPPARPGTTGGPVQVAAGKALFGAYVDLAGMTPTESLRLRGRQLGRDHRIVHVFYAWEDSLPDTFKDVPGAAIPMVSWRGTRYSTITNGSSDAKLAADGRALARYRRPVLLRWAWEMNGDWYEWAGVRNDRDTAGFIAAWRRVHRIFTEQGATNVAWVWSPNHNSRPTDSWNDRARYYPGDAYVDWVGVSGYNFERETPESMFGPIYREFAVRKPVMISEVGAVNRGGRTKPDWITSLFDWVIAHPRVGAVVWFDTDTHPGSPEKWRIDTDAASLEAYKRMATSTGLSG